MPEHPFDDPFPWFDAWFGEACGHEMPHPNAMMLSTADSAGRPSSRVVLLKEHDRRGFVFYTNLESRKGDELAVNPQVALNFWWGELGRQIRIEGRAEPVSEAEADAYFASRPRVSQLGAWASAQSRPLNSRQELEARVDDLKRRYEGGDVPRPPHWSGMRVVPRRIEFWSEGAFRLHERWVFERAGDEAAWEVVRLNP